MMYGLTHLPSAAYMHQWIRWAWVKIIACRLFGTKPLSKPILGYCQLDPYEQTSVKFQSKYYFVINENASENIVILSRGRWVKDILFGNRNRFSPLAYWVVNAWKQKPMLSLRNRTLWKKTIQKILLNFLFIWSSSSHICMWFISPYSSGLLPWFPSCYCPMSVK